MRKSIISVSLAALLFLVWPFTVLSQGTPINMGAADPFAVLAGTDVTNTGPTVITGPTPSTTTSAEVGVSPGTVIGGFPPGTAGAQHSADVLAGQAQGANTAAYLVAAGETPHVPTLPALGGLNLGPGFYQVTSTANLTGTLTLTGTNNPNDLWVFQIGSSLSTAAGAPGAPAATVALVNVLPCQVFWQVTSSATIGTYANFVGTIMALTSITMNTGATLTGRALARNGFVHLDTNTINNPGACGGVRPSPSPTALDQTISFAPLADKILGEPPFVVTATASSGLPVTFTAFGQCSVSGSTVSLTGIGVCTITAGQAGNTSFNAAPNVSQSFHVLSAAQFAQSVIDATSAMGLTSGISNSLTSKVEAYIDAIARGQATAACGQLGAFVNEAAAQSGKQIPAAAAALLIADAARLAIASSC